MSFALKSSDAGALRALAVNLGREATWYTKLQLEELEIFQYHDLLYKLLDLMRATNFIYEFDWMDFGKQADQLIDKAELLKQADLETLRKLFTAHSRNEALKDGHLAEMIDSGHLQQVVSRLVALL
jgi:hypothetical protein